MIPERREAFLAALEDGPKTTGQLSDAMGCDEVTVRRYGRHLEDDGIVTSSREPMTVGAIHCHRLVWRLA